MVFKKENTHRRESRNLHFAAMYQQLLRGLFLRSDDVQYFTLLLVDYCVYVYSRICDISNVFLNTTMSLMIKSERYCSITLLTRQWKIYNSVWIQYVKMLMEEARNQDPFNYWNAYISYMKHLGLKRHIFHWKKPARYCNITHANSIRTTPPIYEYSSESVWQSHYCSHVYFIHKTLNTWWIVMDMWYLNFPLYLALEIFWNLLKVAAMVWCLCVMNVILFNLLNKECVF